MAWLANKRQKQDVLPEPIRAELQRHITNLVEEVRAHLAQMKAGVDTSVASMEKIRGTVLSAAEIIKTTEVRTNDLEARIQKLEQAQRQG